MQPELCTIHASIDAARARFFLQEAKDDRTRLPQVYSDCFFDGSIAAAEAAVLFALKTTDSTARALELADVLKSLPTAIPTRTAPPLAQICAFLAISFSEEECRAPLNTFCYADSVVRRAALRAILERLHDIVRTKPGELNDVLKRVEAFFLGIIADSEEIDRHIVIGRLVGLAYGMSSQVRRDIFYFLLELDTRISSFLLAKGDAQSLEDYDTYLASELAALVTDSKSMAQLMLRSLVHSIEFGTIGSLLTLWTCHREQMMCALPVMGRNSFLFLLLAHAARLACSGNMSGCRHAVDIAKHLLHSGDGVSAQIHEAICSVLFTFCASIGATSSACGDEDVNKWLAGILRYLRVSKKTTDARELLERICNVCQDCRRWECPETTALLGLLLRTIELWKSPPQLRTWIVQHLAVMINSTARANLGADQGSDIAATASILTCEDSALQESSHNESFGALVALLVVSVLGHPTAHVRLGAVEALRNLMNNKTSLFCLPSILMHLQHETNGVVGVNIIRALLSSRSLLQHKETSKIALNACMQSLGQSATKDSFNNTTLETVIVTLGFATESAPGLATSLLLREVDKLKESFGLTRGPVRAAASAAILKLVKSRPSRGTIFVPFISLCIAPESMAVAPEAASLCFEAMNIMTEEEVLDPIKAVKVVMKNYPDVADVESKARRSYLKLVGSVSRGSNTKKGALLTIKVVILLRRCLSVMRPGLPGQGERSDFPLSWEEVGQAARSLGQFTVEEILRLVYATDEPLLDLQAEAERKEGIEKECQEFVKEILSLTVLAHCGQSSVSDLRELLVKIVSHEWENRQRSSFDPDRIAKLRVASDALRRVRQGRGGVGCERIAGIDGFARAVKGLPSGVMKGVFEECIWNADGDEGARKGSCFWIAVRVILAAKALSPALPWVALVLEVILSSKSHGEERASCLAVLRASRGDSFELKDARSRWFGARSSLFDCSVPTSVPEAKELFIGMVQFYPSEAVSLLSKYRASTSLETILDFIRASQELQGNAIGSACQALFPVVLNVCAQGNNTVCETVERDFYEIILSKCEEPFLEELIMNNITEPGAIRIACRVKSFKLLCNAGRVLMADGDERDLFATVGRTVRTFDAAHRREFVLNVCSGSDDDDLRQRQHCLAAHVFGVGGLLPYADLALSVAVCFCADANRDGVRRTVASITQ